MDHAMKSSDTQNIEQCAVQLVHLFNTCHILLFTSHRKSIQVKHLKSFCLSKGIWNNLHVIS